MGPGSERTWAILDRIDAKGSPLPGFKGGRAYQNDTKLLPTTKKDGTAITYREWNLTARAPGQGRSAERLVTGEDGSAYVTINHYETFTMIRGGGL